MVPGLRLAGIRNRRPATGWPRCGGDVDRQLVDGAVAQQVVVERVAGLLAGVAQQQVQAGRLDIGVDDADTLPGHRQQALRHSP